MTKPGQTVADCWCMSASISPDALERIPQDQINKTCICQACATGTDSNADQT
nr:cysteine-rich CWC family protein [Halopseudomonas salegens]